MPREKAQSANVKDVLGASAGSQISGRVGGSAKPLSQQHPALPLFSQCTFADAKLNTVSLQQNLTPMPEALLDAFPLRMPRARSPKSPHLVDRSTSFPNVKERSWPQDPPATQASHSSTRLYYIVLLLWLY